MSNNIYQFQTEEQIYEEASLWVARLDRGLSDAETKALHRWLKQSPKHKVCLLEMADLSDRMDSLAVLSELFDPPVSLSEQQAPQQSPQQQPQKSRGFARTAWAVAASVTALVLAFNVLVPATPWLAPAQEPEQQAPLANTETSNTLYETGIGVHSTVNLPDGTRLLLNTNTQVSVTYSDSQRLLVLKKGELHVEVAHDTTRPLRVQVGGKIVEAVGTAFNVYRRDDKNFDVIVTEGRVQVKPLAEKLPAAADVKKQTLPDELVQELGRGEKLSVRASQPAAVESIGAAVINDRLSWRNGNLVFRGETLELALKELGRYTSDSFKVVDPRINEVRIAGLYKAGDVDGLLLALKENFNINHSRTSDGVIELSLDSTARK